MALKNIFKILVDLKIVRSIDLPLVTQNDSVVFILEVMDNGVPFDLTDTTTISLAHTRKDGTVVVTPGTKEGNIVTFELGTNETAVAGGVTAKAQFYDATGRVSTLSFGYQVGKDPTGSGYVPSVSEQTLIEVVLNDGPLIIASAEEAAAYANEQGDYALQVGVDNETRYLNAVETVALRDSTYPTPSHGDTVRVTTPIDGKAKSYRYVLGTGWVVTDVYNSTAIDQVNQQLADTSKQASAARGGLSGNATITIDVPTYDGNPSITHPDVVYVAEGWNGYRYWMGFTPYPDGARENPSIVASHNGQDWVVPQGLTNPLKTLADASTLGYSYWSDTDLILLPDNRMALYFRGNSGTKEDIYRMTSADGVTWGEFTKVIADSTGGDTRKILSPAVVVEADGTFSMFAINYTLTEAQRLQKRTSSDGIAWSAPSACTIPIGVDSWHVDVIRVKNQYHMLLASNFIGAKGAIYYWTSNNGTTFSGDNIPSIPLSGYAEDVAGHYRSTMVAIPGNPLSFKVWVATWDPSLSGHWHVLYYDNVVLKNNAFRSSHKIDELVKRHDQVFIPSSDFNILTGTPTKILAGFRHQVWQLSHTESQEISAMTYIPEDWRYVRFWILWAGVDNVATGNVAFSGKIAGMFDGQSLSSPTRDYGQPLTAHVAPGRFIFKKSFLWAMQVPVGRPAFDYVAIRRAGLDALDTLDAPIVIMGILLEKAIGTGTPT